MSLDFIHFSCELDMGSPERARAAQALYDALKRDDSLRLFPVVQGFEVVLSEDPADQVLWIHDDDGGNPDGVVSFVLRLAQEFDLTGLWGFQHARWCSRRMSGVFGGGAHLLDLGARTLLAQISTDDWLDQGLARSGVLSPLVDGASNPRVARG